MRAGVLAAMAAVLLVAGCATVRDSRLNPFNWFGRSAETRALAAAPYEGRQPVQTVTELHVEPATGGAIIRAKGVPPTQGWFEGELVLEASEDPSQLAYRFVLRRPGGPQRAGSAISREVTVATFVSDFKLEGVRNITVTGADNARSTRRR